MSHHPPTGAAPVTQNERRADRAMHAIEAGSDCEFRDGAVAGLERDVRESPGQPAAPVRPLAP